MDESNHVHWMGKAVAAAAQGIGWVEPNPPVGCVIVEGDQLLATGFHRRLGGAHAEVEALSQTDASLDRATMYVTLEPCNHFGKTPPCVDAIIARRPCRVVIALRDPNPSVAGGGVERLREAGIDVLLGPGRSLAARQLGPYLKRVQTGFPWIIAKWAMSLDGKIATRSGQSRWLSGPEARVAVHVLRGRVDAILTGIETVLADDPLLTARPPGPRQACRVILDSTGRLPLQSQLVRTAHETPVLIACGPSADAERLAALRAAGCEVWQHPHADANQRLSALLQTLVERGATQVLVESGGKSLAAFQQIDQLDELRLYVAPLVLGGREAPSPIGGEGVGPIQDALGFRIESVRAIGPDVEIVAVRTADEVVL